FLDLMSGKTTADPATFPGMRSSGKIVRPVLRFVASVLITSGILMLVDAVLTVTWQEPVSAYFAHQDQNRLNQELKSELPQVELTSACWGPSATSAYASNGSPGSQRAGPTRGMRSGRS